jgi:hypothetical protein
MEQTVLKFVFTDLQAEFKTDPVNFLQCQRRRIHRYTRKLESYKLMPLHVMEIVKEDIFTILDNIVVYLKFIDLTCGLADDQTNEQLL